MGPESARLGASPPNAGYDPEGEGQVQPAEQVPPKRLYSSPRGGGVLDGGYKVSHHTPQDTFPLGGEKEMSPVPGIAHEGQGFPGCPAHGLLSQGDGALGTDDGVGQKQEAHPGQRPP